MDITQLNWPEGEVRNMEMRRSYHRGADIPPNAPPGFCDNCAQIFSWASKEQKVFELENRIFQSITNESDRESIHSQLEKLITHDISESEEKRIWEKIKTKAGDVLHNESVKEAIYAIASKIALEVLKF